MTDSTNAWLQFLSEQGAQLRIGETHDETHDDAREIEAFAGSAADWPAAGASWMAPLTDLGMIAASGEEAAHFLHNQLTNDVEHLEAGDVRLAGYCSPKGRLLATMLIWRTDDNILLQLPREIQPPIQKRLQMFILRAKAKLADVGDQRVVLGLGGPQAGTALAGIFPTLPAAPWQKLDTPSGTLLRVADAFGAPRYQWICEVDTAMRHWPALAKLLTPVAARIWRLGDIHAAIARITKATQEQFVPQMVNFEVVGGVNFQKGCYPGQEIVARSQYLGKLKRRMLPASVDALDVSAGMEVFAGSDPDQPCGMIVNAERNEAGGADCLVELKLAALDQGAIHLGSAQGPMLRIGTLPYALPDGA